jgi:ribonuclease BN (tRNA processing enzyme)
MLGACGAWPAAGAACSGFLLEQDGFVLLVDAGYATLPRLLELMPAARVDAAVISHGHPDHCADLNPLLRARALAAEPAPVLPVYALPRALDAVLALDRPGMLDDAIELHEFAAGDRLSIGPFTIDTRLLPHWVPNAGFRIAVDGRSVAYTGDCGPDPGVVALAAGADLLIAEATYPEQMPPEDAGFLTTARQAAEQARAAGVGQLLLTHLWPGTDRTDALAAAAPAFGADVAIAESGLVIDLGG